MSTARMSRLMVWVCVDLSALAAFDNEAVGIVVRHIHEQLCFAGTAAIGLVTIAGFDGRPGGVFKNCASGDGISGNNFHIKLWHE